jgi:ABC-type transport system involved in multi-copper enzyme maturation permease subunit
MNTARVLYHLARADFLERARRTSFLFAVALVVFLGYSVNAGQIAVSLGDYRGVYNSAWVGSLMAVVANTFLGLAGFYIVKNAVQRDIETGVGQIMAATPLSRVQYVFGKWLSHLLVLSALVAVMAGAGVIFQITQREVPEFDLAALLLPLLVLTGPMMALTAAWAVLFEAVNWLRGGLGNVA